VYLALPVTLSSASTRTRSWFRILSSARGGQEGPDLSSGFVLIAISLRELLAGRERRVEDVRIGAAAADVCRRRLALIWSSVARGFFSRHALIDIRKPGVQKPHMSASCSQNAVLQRREFFAAREAFDRADRLAALIDREQQARVRRLAVDDPPCTRRSCRESHTSFVPVSAGSQRGAQRVEQRRARLDLQLLLRTVDRELDLDLALERLDFGRERVLRAGSRRLARALGIRGAGDQALRHESSRPRLRLRRARTPARKRSVREPRFRRRRRGRFGSSCLVMDSPR